MARSCPIVAILSVGILLAFVGGAVGQLNPAAVSKLVSATTITDSVLNGKLITLVLSKRNTIKTTEYYMDKCNNCEMVPYLLKKLGKLVAAIKATGCDPPAGVDLCCYVGHFLDWAKCDCDKVGCGTPGGCSQPKCADPGDKPVCLPKRREFDAPTCSENDEKAKVTVSIP